MVWGLKYSKKYVINIPVVGDWTSSEPMLRGIRLKLNIGSQNVRKLKGRNKETKFRHDRVMVGAGKINIDQR